MSCCSSSLQAAIQSQATPAAAAFGGHVLHLPLARLRQIWRPTVLSRGIPATVFPPSKGPIFGVRPICQYFRSSSGRLGIRRSAVASAAASSSVAGGSHCHPPNLNQDEPPPSGRRKWQFAKVIMWTVSGCGLLFAGGACLLIQDVSKARDRINAIQKKADVELRRYATFINKALSFHSSEAMEKPLLPDAADMSYPEGLPTLVVNFDKVIAKMEYDRMHGWRVLRRPGANRFFRELMSHYEIVVWADDASPVAQDVCGIWELPVVGCLHREHCTLKAGKYVKDIGRLGRRLDRVIIADFNPEVFGDHPGNGIVIKPFEGDPLDSELDVLTDFLKAVAVGDKDVRATIARFGGGLDGDIGRRFRDHQLTSHNKKSSYRSMSRLLGLDSVVEKSICGATNK